MLLGRKIIEKIIYGVIAIPLAIYIGSFALNAYKGDVPTDLRKTTEFAQSKAFVENKINQKLKEDLRFYKDKDEIKTLSELKKVANQPVSDVTFNTKRIGAEKRYNYAIGLASCLLGLVVLTSVVPILTVINFALSFLLGLPKRLVG